MHPAFDFIYFDLDDTLLDHTRAERDALRILYQEVGKGFAGIPFDDVHTAYRRINPVVWTEYATGILTKEEAKHGRFERLLASLAVKEDDLERHLPRGQKLGDRYMSAYATCWCELEGAGAAFKAISEVYPVGVLTNGFAEAQHAKLDWFPLFRERSSAVVISEEVGFLKPDPRLFECARVAAGVPAERILYVGDSLSSDVEGGTGAGWHVAWFTTRSHDHPDVFCFSSWHQLLDKLQVS